MTFDYESWLKQAQDRLEELYQQRAAIDEEIANLQRGIEGFTPLVQKLPPWDTRESDSVGITAAVTAVFKERPGLCLSPTQVRDILIGKKVPLNQQNPLATIHQIISRLENRGVIRPLNNEGRRLHYYPQAEASAAEPPKRKFRYKPNKPSSEK